MPTAIAALTLRCNFFLLWGLASGSRTKTWRVTVSGGPEDGLEAMEAVAEFGVVEDGVTGVGGGRGGVDGGCWMGSRGGDLLAGGFLELSETGGVASVDGLGELLVGAG